jgi:hypothetical protein
MQPAASLPRDSTASTSKVRRAVDAARDHVRGGDVAGAGAPRTKSASTSYRDDDSRPGMRLNDKATGSRQ